MEIGGVLSESWELYRRFLGRLFVTAFVVFVVLDLVSGLANVASGNGGAGAVFWGLLGVVVGIVGIFWVQGALVEAVRDVRDGRADRSIGELYRLVQPRLPALIAAGLIAGVAILIGLVLFLVPGLFLLTIWSMIVPVIVLEGRSAGESFSRSRELVRGSGWSVFGLIVLTVVAASIASGIIQLLFAPLPDFLDAWLGGLVAHSLVVPFVALAWTLAYYRLSAAPAQPAAAP